MDSTSHKHRFRLSTSELGFVGVMTGLCVASNYLMISLVNVKFMDLFVFVSGYLMGSYVGVLVGSLTWLVYGTLNPYGFNFPILIATIVGESLYGFFGGVVSKLKLVDMGNQHSPGRFSVSSGTFWLSNLQFALLGFLLTSAYDLFTNIVSGVVAGLPILVAIIAGIPFAVAHEVSNFLFFFFGASILIRAVKLFAIRRG